MVKYRKLLAWVGPIVLPIVITGIRSFFKKKRGTRKTSEEGDYAPNQDIFNCAGHSHLE